MTRPHLILKRYNLNNSKSNYKLENVTSKHCPKCNELLFNEVNQPEIDYPYVCLFCDENFFSIELKENDNKSDVNLFMERTHENNHWGFNILYVYIFLAFLWLRNGNDIGATHIKYKGDMMSEYICPECKSNKIEYDEVWNDKTYWCSNCKLDDLYLEDLEIKRGI